MEEKLGNNMEAVITDYQVVQDPVINCAFQMILKDYLIKSNELLVVDKENKPFKVNVRWDPKTYFSPTVGSCGADDADEDSDVDDPDHLTLPVISNYIQEDPSFLRKYSCPDCNYTSNSRYRVVEHGLAQHSEKEQIQIQCPFKGASEYENGFKLKDKSSTHCTEVLKFWNVTRHLSQMHGVKSLCNGHKLLFFTYSEYKRHRKCCRLIPCYQSNAYLDLKEEKKKSAVMNY